MTKKHSRKLANKKYYMKNRDQILENKKIKYLTLSDEDKMKILKYRKISNQKKPISASRKIVNKKYYNKNRDKILKAKKEQYWKLDITGNKVNFSKKRSSNKLRRRIYNKKYYEKNKKKILLAKRKVYEKSMSVRRNGNTA